jgi:hypothetical protein
MDVFNLERRTQAEREEAYLIRRHSRHLAELRAGRIQRRTEPLLPIEEVLSIDAHLHAAAGPAAKLRWTDRLAHVSAMLRTPSIRNGKARFWNAAGVFAGSRSNPASTLNQRSRVGSSTSMSSMLPEKKMF